MNISPYPRIAFCLLLPAAAIMACSSTGDEPRTAADPTDPDASSDGAAGKAKDSTSPAVERDAASQEEAAVADAAIEVEADASASACGALAPCDPIADQGCPAGQHCMVKYTSASTSEVLCQAAGTSPPEEYLQAPGCLANPCQPGFACYMGSFCQKLCDPSVGFESVPEQQLVSRADR